MGERVGGSPSGVGHMRGVVILRGGSHEGVVILRGGSHEGCGHIEGWVT